MPAILLVLTYGTFVHMDSTGTESRKGCDFHVLLLDFQETFHGTLGHKVLGLIR